MIDYLYFFLFPRAATLSLEEEPDDLSPGFIFGISVFFSIFLALFVFFTTSSVEGLSMYPTLEDGDLLFSYKISSEADIKRGDIVICSKEDFFNNENLVKRIVGMPGDMMEFKNNKVYVDDKALDENYLPAGTITEGFAGKFRIPEGKYIVLGDNRTGSSDSRVFGYINYKDCQSIVIKHYKMPDYLKLLKLLS